VLFSATMLTPEAVGWRIKLLIHAERMLVARKFKMAGIIQNVELCVHRISTNPDLLTGCLKANKINAIKISQNQWLQVIENNVKTFLFQIIKKIISI
jgi:hypothetical protein